MSGLYETVINTNTGSTKRTENSYSLTLQKKTIKYRDEKEIKINVAGGKNISLVIFVNEKRKQQALWRKHNSDNL